MKYWRRGGDLKVGLRNGCWGGAQFLTVRDGRGPTPNMVPQDGHVIPKGPSANEGKPLRSSDTYCLSVCNVKFCSNIDCHALCSHLSE